MVQPPNPPTRVAVPAPAPQVSTTFPFMPAGGMGATAQAAGSSSLSSPLVTSRMGRLLFFPVAAGTQGVTIRLAGPALIDFRCGTNAGGASVSPDGFTQVSFYIVPAGGSSTTGAAPLAYFNRGPYLFVPQGGDYNLVVTNLNRVAGQDGYLFVITDNFNPDMGAELMNRPWVRRTATNAVNATGAGVVTPLVVPVGPGGAEEGHVTGCKISNVGAATVSIMIGERQVALADGHPIVAGGTLEFPPGSISCATVYAFAAAAQGLVVTWYFQ